ncbi:MAG: hypothetical protein F4121_11160, partial [Acidimicrobiia bacterium]|nr:hypothetical protein [Acidimicrobiia bacterium]
MALAKTWTTLPALITTTPVSATPDLSIPDGTGNSSQPFGAWAETTIVIPDEVDFIEFVEVQLTLETSEFRDLEIELISPSGTKSLLSDRVYFVSRFEYDFSLPDAFRFGSARHLGEDSSGTWKLRARDGWDDDVSTIESWSLRFYGHRARPKSPAGLTA